MQARDGCGRRFALLHIASLKEPGMQPYKCVQCGFWHIGHAGRIEGIQSRLDRLIGPDPRTQRAES